MNMAAHYVPTTAGALLNVSLQSHLPDSCFSGGLFKILHSFLMCCVKLLRAEILKHATRCRYKKVRIGI